MDRLDLGLGSLAIDSNLPTTPSDPDVWPPPSPNPSRAFVPSAGPGIPSGPGIAPSRAGDGGGRGGGVNGPSSSRVVRRGREGGSAGGGSSQSSLGAADRARQRLPGWARASSPPNGDGKRGAGGVGVGRRDGVVRGRMVIGGGGGQMGQPRRGNRGKRKKGEI